MKTKMENSNKKFFISTAIPYVNAQPHIGFALELIQADAIARYHQEKGEDVFFVTGTDENAIKNVQAAEKADKKVQEFIDEHAGEFEKLTTALLITNNDFIRTTEERHVKGAQKLWNACLAAGDIYKKKYSGLYCIGCEEFKTEKDLIDGKCPEHGTKPETVEEENYFFKLSKYESELRELIESGGLSILPETRKNETLEFIKSGLKDFSISRSRERSKNWGIPVPDDPEQVMYVWFDALTNYINALGYAHNDEEFTEFWQNGHPIHLIGKGVNRFHAIYWPAMLKSAGLNLPKQVLVHGYVTIEGEKMSKSVGNVVDPFLMIDKYGAEVVRYFLLREIPSGGDGDFSEKKLVDRYNGDLANGLGNLVSRVVTLIDKNLDAELIYKEQFLDADVALKISQVWDAYRDTIENFKLNETLAVVWDLVAYADKYMNDHQPWKQEEDEFLQTMTNLVMLLHNISRMLLPFMPKTAEKIMNVLGIEPGIDPVEDFKFSVTKGAGLFPRLES